MDDLDIVWSCLMHLTDVSDFHPNLYPLLFATCILQVKVNGEPMAMMQDKDSHMYPHHTLCYVPFVTCVLQVKVKGEPMAMMQDKDSYIYPVSYTHLTLPTIVGV